MFCENCGSEIRRGEEFCTNCGSPAYPIPASARPPLSSPRSLEEAVRHKSERSVNQAAYQQPPYQNQYQQPTYEPPQYPPPVAPERPRSSVVPALAVVCAVLAAVLVGSLLFSNGVISFGSNNQTANTPIHDSAGGKSSTSPSTTVDASDQDDESFTYSEPVSKEVPAEPTSPTYETQPQEVYVEQPPAQAPSSSSSGGNSISGFVLPDSSSRYYSTGELQSLSNWDLYIARNEIYARHGRGFKNWNLRDYFSRCTWYTQLYGPDEFDNYHSNLISELEWSNIMTILDLEQARNSPYPYGTGYEQP